jgi:hypothetical protein
VLRIFWKYKAETWHGTRPVQSVHKYDGVEQVKGMELEKNNPLFPCQTEEQNEQSKIFQEAERKLKVAWC